MNNFDLTNVLNTVLQQPLLENFDLTKLKKARLNGREVSANYLSPIQKELLAEISDIAQSVINNQIGLYTKEIGTPNFLEGRLIKHFESGGLSSENFNRKIDDLIKCFLRRNCEYSKNSEFTKDLVIWIGSLRLTEIKVGIEAIANYVLNRPGLGATLLVRLELEKLMDLLKEPDLKWYQIYKVIFEEFKKIEPSYDVDWVSSGLKIPKKASYHSQMKSIHENCEAIELKLLKSIQKNCEDIDRELLAHCISSIESPCVENVTKEISINRVLYVCKTDKLNRLDFLEKSILQEFQEIPLSLSRQNLYQITDDLTRIFSDYARDIPEDSLLADLLIEGIHSIEWLFSLNYPDHSSETVEKQIHQSLAQALEALQKYTLNRVSFLRESCRLELISQAYKNPSITFDDFDAICIDGDSQPLLKADLKDLADIFYVGKDEEGNEVSFKMAPILFEKYPYFGSLRRYDFSKQSKRTIEFEIAEVSFKTMSAINEFIKNPSSLKISLENVTELLSAAGYLQINELEKAAFHFLISNICNDEVRELIVQILDDQKDLGSLFSVKLKESAFLFVQDLEIDVNNVETLLFITSYFQIDELKKTAFHFLISNICNNEVKELIVQMQDDQTDLGKLFSKIEVRSLINRVSFYETVRRLYQLFELNNN